MLIRYGDSPQLQPLSLECNTGDEGLFSNIAAACKLGLPEVREVKAIMPQAVLCGGGPSLADTLENIRELKAAGATIFALNNAAQFLVKNGIRPDKQVMVDPRPENAAFITEVWADELYLCSQCAPEVFAQAKSIGYPVRLFHHAGKDFDKHVPDAEKACFVGGGYTVGLSTICMAFTLGWRQFHLFGYDSSHATGRSHAYAQSLNDKDDLVTCCVANQTFDCSVAMAGQASEFEATQKMLEHEGCTFKVYGSGLLPSMWRENERIRTERVLLAVYDLGVSPPTYDFLSFLIEAERHRVKEGYDKIDVLFQPGPMHGFRNDELPPDVETRRGMLWRVCAGMARLLPSVRNISVNSQRATVAGNVFPEGYAEDRPASHYATAYLHNAEPLLRASGFARRRVAKLKQRYATITLRQAAYWPDRNSNLAEWDKVAKWLFTQGIDPIFIPDTDAAPPVDWHSNTAASLDIDLRAALYEGAVINLAVLNGPASLLPFLNAQYLIFNIVVESAVASSTEFLRAHGFEKGDQMGGNGRLVWEKDTADVIIRELKAALLETTS